MSKKPYVIQPGSNNLVIVPTENYEPAPKKVKNDNNNFIEKVPGQAQCESVINNNVSNQVHYGASSSNNNVLIDVSKIKRQQNSWAANFLQSIGGTPTKPPRLYHNLATKPTLVRKENTIPNQFTQIISNHQPNNKLHESKASALIVSSSTEQPQVKKVRLPDVKVHCCPTKREVPQLNTKKIDNKPTTYKNVNLCKETVNLKSTQLEKTKEKVNPTKEKVNPTPRIINNDKIPERKGNIKLTQLKSNKKVYISKAHKVNTPCKANKEDTKLKNTKGIAKSKVDKGTFSVKSDKTYLKKGDIVLNVKTNKTHEKKKAEFENVRNSLKESKKTKHSEVSPQKESIKSKSPIKSVVKKINNHHTDTHYHKNSDYNPIKGEEMSFKETDADLRSKLKRKNYHHKYDEIRENSILNKKMSTIPKNKGFVPEENLIISFNAESENEEELITKEKAPVKTKKQQTGGNKCKKIKLEINIILKHGDTTDDESIQSEDDRDDQSTNENTDVSFLDDINVDEIVDSLNDLKNNTININTGISSNNETLLLDISKIDVKESIYIDGFELDTAITKDETFNANVKESGELTLLDNNMKQDNHALQSTTHSQRDTSPRDSIKIEEKFTNTVNESKIKSEIIVKEEVSENLPKIDAILEKTVAKNQCGITETSTDCKINLKKESENLSDSVETVHPDRSNINNISSNSEVTLDSDQKHHENANSSIQLTNEAINKVESLDMKTNYLLNTNKSNDGTEDVILIESDTKVEDQQNLVENVTVDLTDIEDDIPQKEVDNDVIIVDTKDVCVINLDAEPILILDTDYDIVLNSNSDKNENNTNVTNDAVIVDSSVGTLCQSNMNDESNEENSMEKHVANDKNNSCTQPTDGDTLVVIKNVTTDRVESNTSETKNDKKTENAKVQNISTKNHAKVLNKDQSTSNDKKTETKDNDSIPKIRNNTLINDTLAKRVEARIESFLGEKRYLTGLIHSGRFSTLYTYEDKNGCKNTIKVLKRKCSAVNLGIDKENMLMKLRKGVPDHKLYCVRLINGFSMSGHWCYLMEYYPKNLREVLDSQKRSFHIDAVRRLSAQLVSAVTLLRNNNIIHSDIKPSHILVSDDEKKLKLCGFDRAFYYDNSILLPNVGTVNYRAPELILGYPADYSIDVWSTALVIYEMATRTMLFPGNYNNDILYKQLCTLDDIPLDMHMHSKFRHRHFSGDAFSRVIGPKGESYNLIYKFYKKERIQSVLFKVYFKEWSKLRSQSERYEDKAKLITLSKLLEQMLVMHPKQRIAIEFVFANPFVYETFDV